ncbi:diiron oxygenase [Deinococcus aluminii]|uniref:Diiron oxygenase n=1 Tax=Deinococcus aluminii TaxID=1656885 RepID=A0ABP9XJL4_9DEIO
MRDLTAPSIEQIFPARFVPYSSHPIITRLQEHTGNTRSRILTHAAYRYLDFTIKLELLVVNDVTRSIALDRAGFSLPPELVLDAYKVYCDEGYHALFSMEGIKQIHAVNLERPVVGSTVNHRYLDSLRQITANHGELARLFFTIVSETLITGYLTTAKSSDATIMALLADHAVDEGRHHSFYSSFLEIITPQITRANKRQIGSLFPDLASAFLFPDLPVITEELIHCGLTVDQAREVLADTYPVDRLMPQIISAGRTPLRKFGELGYCSLEESVERMETNLTQHVSRWTA